VVTTFELEKDIHGNANVGRVILFLGASIGHLRLSEFGFSRSPANILWGLLLLLFRFLLSRRGLGWKITAFVVGWFDVLFPLAVITRVVFPSAHYWAIVSWAGLMISAAVSGAAVSYLPFGAITAVSNAEHALNLTDATAIDSNDK